MYIYTSKAMIILVLNMSWFLSTIVLMEILTGIEVDLFVPSFPELQSIFNLNPFTVELLLSVNLIAHCITSLIAGNLGDRFGRKPIILTGLVIFALGSIICVVSNEFWHLLIGRFLQGVGISAPAVLAYLLISDSYPPERQQQLLGIINGTITLAMAFAPVAGSYINLYIGWRGNFIALLSVGIISLYSCYLFIPRGEANLNIRLSIKEYLPIIKSEKAILYIITIAQMSLVYWIFIGISPILYIDDMNVSLKEFGFYQGSLAITFSLVSFTSSYLIKKFGAKTCMYFSLIPFTIFIICTTFIIYNNILSPLFITITMQFLALGIVFPSNILWPLALEVIEGARGRTAAIIVASRLIFTGLGIQLASYFYDRNFNSLGITICIVLLLSFYTSSKLIRKYKILD